MANILVCDDEKNITEVIGDILKDEGHVVFKAESGDKGYIVCKDEKIDIAILDVLMPIMNGVDLLKKIKKDFPEIHVIMISGHASIDMAVNAIKLGAFDFIEKPPSLNKLLSMVNRIQELKRREKKK